MGQVHQGHYVTGSLRRERAKRRPSCRSTLRPEHPFPKLPTTSALAAFREPMTDQATISVRGASFSDVPASAVRRGCPFSDLKDKLRRVGLRPTRQRVSLGWLLFGKGDRHITAEMLYEEATRARVPVSLATVYNTLHQFTEAGLLRQLAVDGSKAYFDTNPTEHHHFFIEGDDVLIDVPAEGVAVGALPEPPEGLEIAGVEVIVRLGGKGAGGGYFTPPFR